MKVKELINLLQKLDPNLSVFYENQAGRFPLEVVRQIERPREKYDAGGQSENRYIEAVVIEADY